ncbi:hypothetical protein GGS20DRAFT_577783 [Poronia punctata]|nr:hypothetical protein GGS20DRAFT_577783 [Poronia punctata]
MKVLSGIFSSWSHYFTQCCRPDGSHVEEKRNGSSNGSTFAIIQDEPSFMPPPSTGPLSYTPEVFREEPAPRKRRGSGWSSFSARKGLFSSRHSPQRRPQISRPSNFRHVYSESFHFPASGSSLSNPRPSPVRPLELSIALPDTRLSPILPIVDFPSPPITPPPRAYTSSSPSNSGSGPSHQPSYSSMSFHIPRRPVNGSSVFDTPSSDVSSPRPPRPARTRGYSSSLAAPSPIMEDLVERVANAMLERDRLQEQIEDIIERQSIYASSRPSTAHGQPEMEPMPGIPALPPDAPSFSERLCSDLAQSTSTKPPGRTSYQANSSRKIEGRAPPPPLPLRLRPPLRKKKSFSRVSSWLFPTGAEHKREISLDSLTNAPNPVSGHGVFYEVAHPGSSGRPSFDSESEGSWTVEEEQTEPTSLSPSSAAAATNPRAAMAGPIPPAGPRFGWREPIQLPQRKSVGVAC